jgi:hypothetical protein
MLDALEFKLKIDGQLQAHGGFNFDLGVTTVGLGREPINAWLPLYVNRQHWEKVKVKNKFYIYNIYHITIDFYLFIYLTRITNTLPSPTVVTPRSKLKPPCACSCPSILSLNSKASSMADLLTTVPLML